MQEINKLIGYINIAKKASYVIIGRENIETLRTKKFYLIITDSSASDNLKNFAKKIAEEKNCNNIQLNKIKLEQLVNIDHCKIIGIKNKNLSLIIEDLIKRCED